MQNISKVSQKPLFPLYFTIAWLLLNLLQAAFTELFHDEAYYWMYARFLDWGYHDHPPMIALMIKSGYLLFQNELGVRFFTVIGNGLGLWLLWKMTDEKNPLLFFGMTSSMLIFQVSGLLAVPDSPLFLCNVLFFYVYKKYLEKDSLSVILQLSLVIAAMAYSKYHGAMTVFFTLLSNPTLLQKKTFWLVATIAFSLYLPHLFWMYEHDFSSFRFHLGTRDRSPYTIQKTFDYVTGVLLVVGPLTGIILLYAAMAYKVQNQWEKALKFCFWGVLGFLFLLSFRGHIEANWAASAFIPMIIMAYLYISSHVGVEKWFWRLAIPSYVLMLVFRVFLVWDFLPAPYRFTSEFHGWKAWAQQWAKLADGHPIIFGNSYQYTSKYIFYSGQPAFDANNVAYHRTQYDFWDLEKDFQGKKVIYVFEGGQATASHFEASNGIKQDYSWIDAFTSFGKIKIEAHLDTISLLADTEVQIPLTLHNQYPYPIDLGNNPLCLPYIKYYFFDGEKHEYEEKLTKPLDFSLKDKEELIVNIHTPKKKGKYYLIFTLSQCMDYSLNGDFLKVEVK